MKKSTRLHKFGKSTASQEPAKSPMGLVAFVIFPLVLTIACRRPETSSCTQATSTSTEALPASQQGAIVKFKGHQCTAFVEMTGKRIEKTNDKDSLILKGVLWTATHCTAQSALHSKEEAAKFSVFLSDGAGKYYPEFLVVDPLAKRNQDLIELANKIEGRAGRKSADLVRSFTKGIEFTKKSVCRQASDPAPFETDEDFTAENTRYLKVKESERVQKKFMGSHEEVCLTPQEMEAIRFEVSVEDLLLADRSHELWKRLNQISSQPPMGKLPGPLLTTLNDGQKKVMLNLSNIGPTRRVSSGAFFVDLLRWCRLSESEKKTFASIEQFRSEEFSGLCSVRQDLENFVSKTFSEQFLGEDGKYTEQSLAEFGAEKGFPIDQRVASKGGVPSFLMREMGGSVSVSNNMVLEVVRSISENNLGDLSLVTAVNSPINSEAALADNAQISEFKAFPLTGLSKPGQLDFSVLQAGVFRFFQSRSGPESSLKLGKGDSGSLLFWKNKYPMASLHAVNDDPTSGGAATVALPVRKTSETKQEKSQASVSVSERRDPDQQTAGCN